MKHTVIPKGTVLFKKGDTVDRYYLIDTGEVAFRRQDREVTLGPGSLVGELASSFEEKLHGSEARALTDLWFYTVEASEMACFFHANPGTFVRLAKNLRDTLRQGYATPTARTPALL